MAVTLTRFLIAKGKEQVGSLATLDGLTDIKIRRVDMGFTIADGQGAVSIQRAVTLDYTPPGGPPNSALNFFDSPAKDFTVQFVFTAESVLITRTYNMILIDCILEMQGASADRYLVYLGMTREELNTVRQAGL